jgi:rare lipoprotein A
MLMAIALLIGCGEHKQAHVSTSLPPPIARPQPQAETRPPQAEPPEEPPESPEQPEAIPLPANTKAIYEETGIASWYGAPYHNRRGSNGEIYNMHAMTAAHCTLPLGSVVRVTNIKTRRSAIVRITDRGPFIKGRMLDLSLAAAKATDVWGPGLAQVKMEVLQTPAPLDSGGRWAVQIGAFEGEQAANDVADHLSRRYHTAKVLRFSSVIGNWWVRVRVQDDDRHRAEEIAHDAHTPEGSIFLVRLD